VWIRTRIALLCEGALRLLEYSCSTKSWAEIRTRDLPYGSPLYLSTSQKSYKALKRVHKFGDIWKTSKKCKFQNLFPNSLHFSWSMFFLQLLQHLLNIQGNECWIIHLFTPSHLSKRPQFISLKEFLLFHGKTLASNCFEIERHGPRKPMIALDLREWCDIGV